MGFSRWAILPDLADKELNFLPYFAFVDIYHSKYKYSKASWTAFT